MSEHHDLASMHMNTTVTPSEHDNQNVNKAPLLKCGPELEDSSMGCVHVLPAGGLNLIPRSPKHSKE